MSARYPDFTDVFNANARMRDAARKGLDLAEAGDKKGARAMYKQAMHWEKEALRLERAIKAGGSASRAPARKKLPRRKAPS